MPIHMILYDTWADLARLFQDAKTWDFIGNVGYAAAIGIGGFVVRKFGLKIRKNATAIGAITTDVLTMAKENETLKLELAAEKEKREAAEADITQIRTDYLQQLDSYRMLDHIFELSKGQWSERERVLLLQLAAFKKLPDPKILALPESTTPPHKEPETDDSPQYYK